MYVSVRTLIRISLNSADYFLTFKLHLWIKSRYYAGNNYILKKMDPNYHTDVYKCLVKYLDMLMQSENVDVVLAARLWADHIISISEEICQMEKVNSNEG